MLGGYVLGGLEVLLTAVPGIGDILPPGAASPETVAFLQRWLPGSLTGYRDGFVFLVLILVLLFRPNGILGKREP
jgi:branched-subunit amino acid ABC-type transport system permease component